MVVLPSLAMPAAAPPVIVYTIETKVQSWYQIQNFFSLCFTIFFLAFSLIWWILLFLFEKLEIEDRFKNNLEAINILIFESLLWLKKYPGFRPYVLAILGFIIATGRNQNHFGTWCLPMFANTEKIRTKTQELTIDYYSLPPIFWTFRHPKSGSSSLYKRIPKMFVCPKTKTMTPTFVLHFGSQCRGNLIYVLSTTVNVFLVEFDMRA